MVIWRDGGRKDFALVQHHGWIKETGALKLVHCTTTSVCQNFGAAAARCNVPNIAQKPSYIGAVLDCFETKEYISMVQSLCDIRGEREPGEQQGGPL